MQFIEYCTESERQNGCKSTVWSCSCSIAQHHEGGLSIILLAQEKTKKGISLSHHHKVKNL